MVSDLFSAVLSDLGRVIMLEGLAPDKNNSCMLRLKTGVRVQMEPDREGRYLIIGSDLGTPALGKYRENLFREALKANGLAPPRYGILGYSPRLNKMFLYERLPLKEATGSQIVDLLGPFSQKAEIWRDAIAKGDIPQVEAARRPTGIPGGIFGIR